MKNVLNYVALLSVTVMSSCEKYVPVVPPSAPDGDASNNVCVIYQYHGTENSRPSCGLSTDLRFSDQQAKKLVQNMVNTLEWGVSGHRYHVLSSDYALYNKTRCRESSEFRDPDSDTLGFYAALTWVKYDCRGVAVDVKLFGPFPNAILDSKKAEFTQQVLSEGYKIAYIAYESAGAGTNLSYIAYYVYRPDPNNVVQRAVVTALDQTQLANSASFNSNRSLSDTLRQVSKVYPGVRSDTDFQQAEAIQTAIQRMISGSRKVMEIK